MEGWLSFSGDKERRELDQTGGSWMLKQAGRGELVFLLRTRETMEGSYTGGGLISFCCSKFTLDAMGTMDGNLGLKTIVWFCLIIRNGSGSLWLGEMVPPPPQIWGWERPRQPHSCAWASHLFWLLSPTVTCCQTLSYPKCLFSEYKSFAPASPLNCDIGHTSHTSTFSSPYSQPFFLKITSLTCMCLYMLLAVIEFGRQFCSRILEAELKVPIYFWKVVSCFPIFQGIFPLSFRRGAWWNNKSGMRRNACQPHWENQVGNEALSHWNNPGKSHMVKYHILDALGVSYGRICSWLFQMRESTH